MPPCSGETSPNQNPIRTIRLVVSKVKVINQVARLRVNPGLIETSLFEKSFGDQIMGVDLQHNAVNTAQLTNAFSQFERQARQPVTAIFFVNQDAVGGNLIAAVPTAQHEKSNQALLPVHTHKHICTLLGQ